MGILTGVRQITRNDDGVSLRFEFEDWASDVPLPPNTAPVGFGENHELIVYPEWRFTFRPEATYDALSGMFKAPLPLGETVSWFRRTMRDHDWIEAAEKSFVESTWASLKFRHPLAPIRVNISLRWRGEPSSDTEITIWRVQKHASVSSVAEHALQPMAESA